MSIEVAYKLHQKGKSAQTDRTKHQQRLALLRGMMQQC